MIASIPLIDRAPTVLRRHEERACVGLSAKNRAIVRKNIGLRDIASIRLDQEIGLGDMSLTPVFFVNLMDRLFFERFLQSERETYLMEEK